MTRFKRQQQFKQKLMQTVIWGRVLLWETQHLLKLSSDTEMGNTTNAQSKKRCWCTCLSSCEGIDALYVSWHLWSCKFHLQHDCRWKVGLHRSSDTPDSEIFAPAWGDRFKTWSQNRTQTRVSIWARIGGSSRESLLAQANPFRRPRIQSIGARQVKNRSSPRSVTPCHTDNRRLLKRFQVSIENIQNALRFFIKSAK